MARRYGMGSMPKGFDFFDADDLFGEQPPAPTRPAALVTLERLEYGCLIRVGRSPQVWRVFQTQGPFVAYVTKHNTAGRKFYEMRAANRDDYSVEIREAKQGAKGVTTVGAALVTGMVEIVGCEK